MGNSEYFADKRLKQTKLAEEKKQCELGIHKWSNWFSVPSGLMRECLVCHETQSHPEHDILAKEDLAHDKILEDLHK